MGQSDYKTISDIKRLDRLRELQKELPVVCTAFFRSISQTTSTLTRLAYAYDFRVFFQYLCAESPAFADYQSATIPLELLKEITGHDIENFQDYLMQYYKNTPDGQVLMQNHELGIMRKLSSIRSLFDYLYRNGIVEANVTTLVSLPKLHDKPILRLDADEMKKMIDAAASGEGLSDRQNQYRAFTGTRDFAMIMLFLGTGIRVSECVGIDISDIDFDTNAFVVTRKGGNQVILYFPQEVADALNAYLKERIEIAALPGHEDALFLSLQKKRMTQRAVQLMVKKYAAVAAPLKQKISPHKLRSTFGTNLYLETGDIYLVADVLGHSDVNTTRKHYADMTDSKRREAARHVRLPSPEENK
ncbi:MAG: tyrosine-type recombinase/integrase [Clostridia bacterium]|nr:tyrosine-type recombinase/integrase [Clostridia bacterium]